MEELTGYLNELIGKISTHPKLPNIDDQIILNFKSNLEHILVIIENKKEITNNNNPENNSKNKDESEEIFNIGNHLLEEINNFTFHYHANIEASTNTIPGLLEFYFDNSSIISAFFKEFFESSNQIMSLMEEINTQRKNEKKN